MAGERGGSVPVGRLAAVLAWLSAAWVAVLVVASGYSPAVVLTLALIVLGVGAWRHRPRMTFALGVLGMFGAIWFGLAALRHLGGTALPPALAINAGVAAAMAVLALLAWWSMRSSDHPHQAISTKP